MLLMERFRIDAAFSAREVIDWLMGREEFHRRTDSHIKYTHSCTLSFVCIPCRIAHKGVSYDPSLFLDASAVTALSKRFAPFFTKHPHDKYLCLMTWWKDDREFGAEQFPKFVKETLNRLVEAEAIRERERSTKRAGADKSIDTRKNQSRRSGVNPPSPAQTRA